MKAPREEKLKSVLEAVPSGFVVDARWLETHGVSRFLTRKYISSGWLDRLERGVFRRPAPHPTPLSWETCLLSLQHLMDYKVHAGGITALGLQGYRHYLPLGAAAPVWLYGDDIPTWLPRLKLDAPITIRSLSLFSDPALGLTETKSDSTTTLPWGWKLRMSAPERAILEALDELPENESFHNLDMVFEGLATLSPRRLSELLRSCRKIKVRRLFFVFADRHKHAWRERLNPDEFTLGTGDRALVKGGKIHPRYRIMVPAEFVPGSGDPDGP
ncbi:type IV toxin-antitoxin system AbiEi family antitoxin domain-containing protein [Sinorhizobium meliloti]|uniref:type IV toxin-antitoxin system AbiEi family antitoxin domain-containing protein n=1 Tax=Rhizobium meliloti TaxID=382 RepID=UPI0002F4EBCB|nr:type IV toxin-antitoxin system AbiEi family antitoxin domain-containing protein [Sinorhizobium meliloti]MDE3767566.1 type IV toxin-antitoxin system AbiEi family antitoxin [Sinorhizobium meliloti]MDE3779804.1 type IV toxin-antitoxin system AbiEi family antitoxin [Sinorhizobium meliloti]MDE3807429.1 type IV toxin-antitoxin system AbiEi family antitoxin [Sinorhizobium meliloti]